MSETTIDLPGYRAGTWVLDASHSEVNFSVRHMLIAKARGTFGVKEATIIAPENPLELQIDAKVDAASIDTNDEGRDAHLRSADFFDVENHPSMEFHSKGLRYEKGELLADGELTIRGTTKPVTFEIEFGGFVKDMNGSYRGGATAKTVINREDFGLTWNALLESGGAVVGKDVTVTLELEGTFQE